MAVPIEPRHVCILFRRFLHFGEDVTRAVRRGARGARRAARAGRRQVVPRSRGGRDASARRSRRSSGRTTSCRCSRRCAARCSRSTMSTLLRIPPSLPAASIRSECPAMCRAELAPGRRRTAAAAPSCTGGGTTGRSPTRITELLDATRAHVGFVLRPAASRRSPTCCTSPSSRGSTKRAAGCRSAASSRAAGAGRRGPGGRSADPRRGQRRRAADDRAQGEGPRVPDRRFSPT